MPPYTTATHTVLLARSHLPLRTRVAATGSQVSQAPVNEPISGASALNITNDTPPTMLVQAEDDPVHVENARCAFSDAIFALEDAIGSHACSLEANMRVTNGSPLGSPLLLPLSP